MSPELARGDADIDSRTDIYSLGATLYHMLTGAPPYLGGSNAEVMSMHLTQPVPDARHANPNVSEYASALITKAMAKDRNDRYATVREFADDVEALLSGESLAFADALSPTPPQPAAAEEPHTIPPPSKAPRETDAPAEPVTAARSRRPVRQARSSLPRGKIAGLAAGLVFLAIIGACVLWPTSTPSPTEPKPTASKDASAFAVARNWELANPGRYAEALAGYRRLKSTLTDPVYQKKTEEAIRSVEAARARAADRAFRGLKARADELKRSGAYSGAIAAYGAAPPELRGVLRRRIERTVAKLDAEATAKIKLALDQAQALLDKGEPTEGMKELHRIAPIRFAALGAERKALRDKLERAALTRTLAARKRLGQLLQSMDAPAMKGDLRAAANIAIAAARDPELAYVQPSADALARIGAALLKADKLPNRTLTATTTDEHIAAAILALAAEDAAKMEACLQQTDDHEFRSHYAIELRQLKERLKERQADQQQRLQMRLAEFRSTLPPLLKRRRYDQALAEINAIIDAPHSAPVKADAMADRRVLLKLSSVLRRVRSNVRGETVRTTATKTPTRHRGMRVTVEAYDRKTDKVSFSNGRSATIATMRAADLKALLEISRDKPAAHHESLALFFAAEGERQAARKHLASVAQRADVEHLTKILGDDPKSAATADAPKTSTEVMAKLTPQEQKDLQAALAKNRELFNTYWRAVGKLREKHKKKYQEKVSDDWTRINHQIRAIQIAIDDDEYCHTACYYQYNYRTPSQLNRCMADARRDRAALARKTRLGL